MMNKIIFVGATLAIFALPGATRPYNIPSQQCMEGGIEIMVNGLKIYSVGCKGAAAQTFFTDFVESVLPKLNEVVTSDGEDVKLEILKLCAKMSPHGLTDENIKAAIEPVYNLLLNLNTKCPKFNKTVCSKIISKAGVNVTCSTMCCVDENCNVLILPTTVGTPSGGASPEETTPSTGLGFLSPEAIAVLVAYLSAKYTFGW